MAAHCPPCNSLARRRIAQDGACLFNSLIYLCQPGSMNANELREHCASTILGDAETYNEVYLDKEPAAYADWIRDPVQYGGEIEIIIIANYFNAQITVVDCQIGSSAELLTYGPESATKRVFIVYSGRHYDALVTTHRSDGEVDDGTCVRHFDAEQCEAEGGVEAQARAFATAERARMNTDLLTRIRKKIKCGGCGELLADNDAFQEHCMEKEHDDDFAYDCTEVEVTEVVGSAEDD